MKQLNFLNQKNISEKLRAEFNPSKVFGGSLIRGKRKSKRPLNFKLPVHAILKCNTLRSGSLIWNADKISEILDKFAKKLNVKIYEKVIASNHIHLILKFERRESYNAFVRAFSGVVSRILKIVWQFRPWTRVLAWGRDFRNACAYTKQNHLEAIGEIEYRPRRLKRSGGSTCLRLNLLNNRLNGQSNTLCQLQTALQLNMRTR